MRNSSRKGSSLSSFSLLWPLVALGLILLFNFIFTAGFFQVRLQDGHLYGSVVDILTRSSPVMLLSLGMTLVIATGGVDLSVGAITAIAGAIAAVSLQSSGLTGSGGVALTLAIALPLLASIACGLWNGFLVADLGVQPIVATLVLMVAGRGIAQLITHGQIISISNSAYHFIGGGHLLGFPFSVTLVIGVLVVVIGFSRKTAMGLFIEAVGNNPVASRYAGVNTLGVKLLVYAVSGLCAGLAGLVISSDISAADVNNSGLYLELDAILAVVIGGTVLSGGRFQLMGSIIGALIIQALATTINTRGVPVQLTLVIKALVVLAVCLLQSPSFRARFRQSMKPGLPRITGTEGVTLKAQADSGPSGSGGL